ncbi:MAG: hypothetical protein ABI954_05925 [Pyrinomonadaceae bacterium]
MINSNVRWNRVLLFGGVFLMLLGAFHLVIQLIAPRPWESNIGWRKPILFGLSTGITLVSLSWVVAVVKNRREWVPAAIVSVLACAEVLIITIQTWRSVPAHFNNGSAVDQMLANSIDAMLVLITLTIFYLTWQSFKSQNIESDWLLSLRLGMIYLSFSCLLGFGVAIYGNLRLGIGGDPTVVNPNGVPKFIHGMPLHALQILPALVFFLRLVNTNIDRRKTAVWFVSHAVALATLYAFWQTVNGMGRFEINPVGVLLLSGSGICGLAALFFALPLQIKTRTFLG